MFGAHVAMDFALGLWGNAGIFLRVSQNRLAGYARLCKMTYHRWHGNGRHDWRHENPWCMFRWSEDDWRHEDSRKATLNQAQKTSSWRDGYELSHARKRRSRKDSGLYIHNNKKKNWGTRLWYTHQTFSVLLALSVSSRIYFFCGRNLLYIFPLYYLTSEKCGFRGRKLFTVSRMWNR